ncbi:MAG: hypothetical protein ACK8QZ_09260, partial [Anaerolineales bacterium]
VEAVNVTGDPISPELNRFLAKVRRQARHHFPAFLLDWARQVRLAGTLEKLRKVNRSKRRPSLKQQLDEETRQWLRQYFYADIEQLENLLGVDLSTWKK